MTGIGTLIDILGGDVPFKLKPHDDRQFYLEINESGTGFWTCAADLAIALTCIASDREIQFHGTKYIES